METQYSTSESSKTWKSRFLKVRTTDCPIGVEEGTASPQACLSSMQKAGTSMQMMAAAARIPMVARKDHTAPSAGSSRPSMVVTR